ncbi:MAG: hypothetical protein COV67_00050 [Nitrospinae bacterium CG11_big_fil_rev_8_21_14_0_20_56_8]|nr:MAG: hypothetical protein COV67_00050 [Nitrospinae bacterium CG11_big_fil_rev_8_21_14_0_20_56_8]
MVGIDLNNPTPPLVGGQGGLSGSAQGARRTEIINKLNPIPGTPFVAFEAETDTTRELGGDRTPKEFLKLGIKEVNTAASTQIVVPPEVGRGSITDSFA